MESKINSVLTVTAKAEKSLLRRHPWIFSGAVVQMKHEPLPGDTVAVYSSQGKWLAWAAYSPQSQIRARVWSFASNDRIDQDFFSRRLRQAVDLRERLGFGGDGSARRLVNAESDGLPGLIIDQYDRFAVCQFLSTGAERWKEVIVDHLRNMLPVEGIYERSDVDARAKEGLAERCGSLWGTVPEELIRVNIGRQAMWVDLQKGHKTGLYLDQRENQALAARFASGGTDVLNCFSYTGAFGIIALQAGAARITQLDASAAMLDLARRNLELNGLPAERAEYLAGNAFEILRGFRDRGRSFDLIVLDPPKFVAAASQMEKGSRGYKDINLLAFKLLRPGGILMTFSCSGLMTAPLFQKIVADAALDAGRDVRVIRTMGQAPDHPVALNFPEGAYLKGLICVVE